MKEAQVISLDQARKRHSIEIEKRVRAAIFEICGRGMTPSFYNVANSAQVARSTLYRKPELKSLIQEARAAALHGNNPFASKLEQLEQENSELRDEIVRLRREQAMRESIRSQRVSSSSCYEYAICSFASAA